MITTLKLFNFMCYEGEHTFTFSEGLNAIIGENDQGKSTLFTAFSWVLWGRPSGDTVESWDACARDTWAEIVFDTGITIRRERKKGVNSYQLTKNGRTRSFTAFGNSIPEEITNTINMTDINFQGQANNLFPMQLTPSELGASINRAHNLSLIHQLTKNLKSQVRSLTKQQQTVSQQYAETQDELTKYAWISAVDGKCEELQRTLRTINNNKQTLDTVRTTLTSSTAHEEERNILLQNLKKQKDSLTFVSNLYQELSEIKNFERSIISAYETLHTLQIVRNSTLELVEQRNNIDQITVEMQRLQELSSQKSKIEALSTDIQTMERLKIKENALISRNKTVITEIRKKLPPVCPLCGEERKSA